MVLFFSKIAFFIPVEAKATKLFQILNSYVSISEDSRLFQESLDGNFMTSNY
jgi:hypothetical protein